METSEETKPSRTRTTWTDELEEKAEGFFKEGLDVNTIAATVGVSKQTLKNRLPKYFKKRNRKSSVQNGNGEKSEGTSQGGKLDTYLTLVQEAEQHKMEASRHEKAAEAIMSLAADYALLKKSVS